MTKDSDPTAQAFVEAYLDAIQAQNPGTEGAAVRAALLLVHEQTREAERYGMAVRIFTHIRELCLKDLSILRAAGLDPDFCKMLAEDPGKTLDTFLSNTYSVIVHQISLVGDLEIQAASPAVQALQAALPPPSIQVADELSEDDKKIFDSEVLFGKALKVGQA